MPTFQAAIAAGARAERERAGLTQDQVAAGLGVDRSTVARIESGKRPLGLTEELLRLCTVLDCTLDDLADRCTDKQRATLGLPPRS